MKALATIGIAAIVAGLTSNVALAQMKITTPAARPSASQDVPAVASQPKVLTIPRLLLEPNRTPPASRSIVKGLSDACGTGCPATMRRFIFHGAPILRDGGPALIKIIDGEQPETGSRIIGGTVAFGALAPQLFERIKNAVPITAETAAPENPFMRVVAITYTEWGTSTPTLCTGIVLDGKHVLTAGHCGCADHTTYRITIDDKMTSQASGFVLEGPPSLLDQRVCRDRFLFGNDLALLTMKNPFVCSAAIGNVDAPKSDARPLSGANPKVADCRTGESQLRGAPYRTFGFPIERLFDLQPPLAKGESLVAVGYGYTETHSIGALMQGAIPVKSIACIEPEYAQVCAPYAELILASAPGGSRHTDTCGGDSGGPIFRLVDGRYILVGITSRPAPFSHVDNALHCGGGGIYTLIGRSTVQNWLRANGVQEETIRNFASK